MIRDLVTNTRSCRRFFEDHFIPTETLKDLIGLARLSASAANLQPLKYMLSNEEEMNAVIFSKLKWAAYLKDWDGPEKGERPSAYIIVLGDRGISSSFGCDHGIATQSILLGATEIELGGCIVAAVERKSLSEELNIPGQYEILHVIVLGKPKERIIIETVGSDGDIKYWRDDSGVHHVPKRSLEEIIIRYDKAG
jgi:nitroreductase